MAHLQLKPSPARVQSQRGFHAAVGRRTVHPVAALRSDEAAQPGLAQRLGSGALAAAAALVLTLGGPAAPALAVSGGKGGLSTPISGEDYSNRDLRKLNFTKAVMRQTNFSGSNMAGVSLFGALAIGANFTGADLTGADLESGMFEDADLTNAVLVGAFANNAQFKGVKSITGSDWTDVLLRKDIQKDLCSIAAGTNPKTGVDTRESLLCP